MPRNRQAFERGQEHRARIKALLADHQRRSPWARPLTAKELHGQYPHIKPSTIAWHIAELRYEAQAESLMRDIRGAGTVDSLENL